MERYLYFVFAASLLALTVGGVIERRRHQRSVDRIPTRILVNGIRGKSSITRLTAGALRGGGLRVVAKTTGTAARFIYPDGTEEPVYRKFGIANVVEQIGIVRRAAAERPDAMVIECMAVQPSLQELNQEIFIQSQIGVLCNVREDHLDEMGPTLDDVARSLSRSMPIGGVCITAERKRFRVLQEEARKRNCRLHLVYPEEVSDDEMRGFSYITFKENVAIALAVAGAMGVSREAALAGMYRAAPDPGVLTVQGFRVGNGVVRLVNIFAANDPRSTVMNFHHLVGQGHIVPPVFTLINCRPDRVGRNAQMGEILEELRTDVAFLIGHPTKSARDAIPSGWRGEVVDLGGLQRRPEEIWQAISDRVRGVATVVAIGNIHGQGEQLLEHIHAVAMPVAGLTPTAVPGARMSQQSQMSDERMSWA